MADTFFIDRAVTDLSSEKPYFYLRHNLHEHPALQLPALEQLANRLMPNEQCRFVEQGMKPDSPFVHESQPADGRHLQQVFENIESPGSWIALYDVQKDPEYRALMDELMSYARHLFPQQDTIRDVRGFIFISSPPSVTPFHIDRENNFWLQLRGQKELFLWDRYDERVVDPPDARQFIWNGSLENVRLTDDKLALGQRRLCKSGDGAYFPSTTPHMTRSETDWVTPGDGVTVSIGIVFYTNQTRHEAHVHACNVLLGKFGFSPLPPGTGGAKDTAKALIGRFFVALMKRFRGYRPTASFTN